MRGKPQAIFGPDLHRGAKNLDAWLAALGISTRPAAFGIGKGEWSSLVEDALTGERGLNFAGSKKKFLKSRGGDVSVNDLSNV